MAKQKKKTGKKPKDAPKNKGGRPTLFKKEYIELVYLLCRKGFTDKELADALKIAESTLNLWKQEHPEFMESIKKGKDEFNTNGVENALLKRAMGYDFEETHTEIQQGSRGTKQVVKKVKKHIAPDVLAQIFWLKNRDPNRWKDKQEIEHSGEVKSGVLVVPNQMSKEEWLKQQQNPESKQG